MTLPHRATAPPSPAPLVYSFTAPLAAQALPHLIEFFENLAPENLAQLEQIYHPEAYFKDPFNEVCGVVAIRHIFEHMFASLEAPRFIILSQVAQGDEAFLNWDFSFSRHGRPLRIHGASHLRFSAGGRVNHHRDYWDAAEELYAKLPLLGTLMRCLQHRLASACARASSLRPPPI
jgi:steroid delta-isomerase